MILSCCKKLSVLFCKIISKRNEEFLCLNCFHSYTTKDTLKKPKNVRKNHGCCQIKIPEKNKILKYNQGEKFMKVAFIIDADMESLLKKIIFYYDNPKKTSTSQINMHTALFTYCLFDASKNNQYRGKDCTKIFCRD